MSPPPDPAFVWRALHPIAFVWWGLAAASLPRSVWAVFVAVAAAAVGVGQHPGVWLHVDKAHALMLGATGRAPIAREYGDAYAAVLSWPAMLVGGDPGELLPVFVGVFVLTALFLYDLTRRTAGRPAALAACALLIALPGSAVATTESRFGLVMLLQVAAVAGLARRDTRGSLLTGLSAGLLAHTRPLQAGVALLLLGALVLQERRVPLAIGAGLGMWLVRASVWLADPPGTSGLQLHTLDADGPWRHPVGPDAAITWLDPTYASPAMGLGIVVAAGWVLWRGPRLGRLAVALLVVDTALYAHQPAIADRLRFQLPALAWVASLGGMAWAEVISRSRPAGVAALVAMALSWPQPLAPFAWQEAHHAWLEATAELPPGTRVSRSTHLDPDGRVLAWCRAASGLDVVAHDGSPPDADLLWIGLADHAAGQEPPDLDGRPALSTATITPRWGGLAHYGDWDDAPLTVGLYGPRSAATDEGHGHAPRPSPSP